MRYIFIIGFLLLINLTGLVILDTAITWTSVVIDIVAIFLGVLGGFYASRKIEVDKQIRKFIGVLETIDAELLFNIEVAQKLVESTLSRPSLSNRDQLPSDRVYKLLVDEELFTSKLADPLSDDTYIAVVSIINEIDNRKLFQHIVNSYKKTKVVKFVIQLTTLEDYNVVNYSEDQKKEFIRMIDERFNKIVDSLNILIKEFALLREELQTEIRKLIANTSLRP